MRKFGVLLSSTIGLVLGVVFLSVLISSKLNMYKDKKEEIATALNFENRLMNGWEWIPGNTIGADKVEEWRTLENKAKAHYNGALIYSAILAGVIILYFVLNTLYARGRVNEHQLNGFVMIFSALSLLYLGLNSPMMEIHAYNKDLTFEVPIDVNFDEMDYIGALGLGEFNYDYKQVFEGRTYYMYQNKSIFELVGLLYTGGNFLVAILVILFSIIFPLIKLIVSLVILVNPEKPINKRRYNVVRNLGKWSMAEVFVVSILLAVFSFSRMDAGVDTGSTTLIGTYFFVAFVIISISSGAYLKKAMGAKNEISV